MANRERDRDRERLIPIQVLPHSNSNHSSNRDGGSNTSSESVSPVAHTPGKEAIHMVIRSWAWKKFMTGCVILLPIAITVCITWWFISSVDGFFSPIYAHFGINVFGLGFVTSITCIFLVGVFTSSWLGASVLGLGEWFIKKMPLVSYIYSASKQISVAISPDQNSNAFKEVAIIRHPRNGEYAFGFITSVVILRGSLGPEELSCVYVPTNNFYLGDIFLIGSKDILRPNLSVREGIEIVISGGVSIPQILTTMDVPPSLEPPFGHFKIPSFQPGNNESVSAENVPGIARCLCLGYGEQQEDITNDHTPALVSSCFSLRIDYCD